MTNKSLVEKFEAALADTEHGIAVTGSNRLTAVRDTWKEAITLIHQHEADSLAQQVQTQITNERMCINGQWWVPVKDYEAAREGTAWTCPACDTERADKIAVMRENEELKIKYELLEGHHAQHHAEQPQDAALSKCYIALDRLVQLKEYKDKNGADLHYQGEKPYAWRQAKAAIAAIGDASDRKTEGLVKIEKMTHSSPTTCTLNDSAYEQAEITFTTVSMSCGKTGKWPLKEAIKAYLDALPCEIPVNKNQFRNGFGSRTLELFIEKGTPTEKTLAKQLMQVSSDMCSVAYELNELQDASKQESSENNIKSAAATVLLGCKPLSKDDISITCVDTWRIGQLGEAIRRSNKVKGQKP